MPTSVWDTTETIPLNTSRVPRSYMALIKTSESRKKQTRETAIAWKFRLACFGAHPQGGLGYKVQTQKHLLLDHKSHPVQTFNKAQTIALKTASINNKLVLRVSPHFGLLEVINTEQIRNKWEQVKAWLLETYPDSKGLVSNFDWQLQGELIQKRYVTDPFYSFFFGDFFDRVLPYSDQQILANGLEAISLPVKREVKISEKKPLAVELESNLNSEDPEFPNEEMNAFLGQLLGQSGREHALSFYCKGEYTLHPETGFINTGSFTCTADIADIYSKTISITLKREDDG